MEERLSIYLQPRLSVDIDLTNIPIEDRTTSFIKINNALDEIKKRLNIPYLLVVHEKDKLKLQVSNKHALIKIEVNQGIRGLIVDITTLVLCDSAQEDFDAFCSIQGVSFGQLYVVKQWQHWIDNIPEIYFI